MNLKKSILEAIGKWLAKAPQTGEAVGKTLTDWLAKQPGADHIEVPMRCPACSYEWTGTADLTKGLAQSVQQLLRCPICGSQPARIRGSAPTK